MGIRAVFLLLVLSLALIPPDLMHHCTQQAEGEYTDGQLISADDACLMCDVFQPSDFLGRKQPTLQQTFVSFLDINSVWQTPVGGFAQDGYGRAPPALG
jgi:hypothetical protein